MKRTGCTVSNLLIAAGIMVLGSGSVLHSQSGLVGYWSFDEPLGDNYIMSESEDDRLVLTGAEQVPGVYGQALYFNGDGSYATIENNQGSPPDALKNLGKGTISFWFRVDYIPPENGIAPIFYYGAAEACNFFDAANKGFIIEVGHSPVHYQSERLYFTAWKNGCTFPSFCYDSRYAIPKGHWHHLAVIVGEDYNTGYLNGEEMTDRRYNFGSASSSEFFEDALVHEKIWLGRGYWDEVAQYYEGAVDELRIYNRPLSRAEVKNLYDSNTLVSLEKQPVANSGIGITPNPASGMLNYTVHDVDILPGTLEIISLSGKRVYSQEITGSTGTVDTTYLPEGNYSMVIRGESGMSQKKFTILR